MLPYSYLMKIISIKSLLKDIESWSKFDAFNVFNNTVIREKKLYADVDES